MTGEVVVLRLGHRKGRDPRITTHLGLVARTFGATKFVLAGDEDKELFDGLRSVCDSFGGSLETEHVKSPMAWLKHFVKTGVAVHLTMYGIPFRQAIPSIRRDRPLVIVVGGAKVPRSVYEVCQYNVAVGSQPHSEVAALALFLDSWVQSPEFFEGARLTINPHSRGKDVSHSDESE